MKGKRTVKRRGKKGKEMKGKERKVERILDLLKRGNGCSVRECI